MPDLAASARGVPEPQALCTRDALFLLAHDEYKGFRCRLHPAVLDLGLGAAVLADLVLLGRLGSTSRAEICVLDYSPAGDVVSVGALDALVATPRDPGLAVLAAIDVVAVDLGERTRAFLLASGVLATQRRRFGRMRYGPASDAVMVSAWMPARRVVQDGQPDPIGLALCPLVQALGLHDTLYLADYAELDTQLTDVGNALRAAQDPYPLLQLIADTMRDAAEERAVAVYR